MSNDCGCGGMGGGSKAGTSMPNLLPPHSNTSEGDTSMSDQSPTLIPPASAGSFGLSAAGDAAPSLTPGISESSDGGVTAWNNSKRVSALWGINQNRNSWVHVPGVGWKKLANNSDSAVMALTVLAVHAKQTQTAYNYRDEADGMIHESYVW